MRSLQLQLVARVAGQLRQRLVELARALAVGPAYDAFHPGRGGRGRVEQRRQTLLGRDRPEVTTFDSALIELARSRQTPCHLECAVPRARASQRRPRVAWGAGE